MCSRCSLYVSSVSCASRRWGLALASPPLNSQLCVHQLVQKRETQCLPDEQCWVCFPVLYRPATTFSCVNNSPCHPCKQPGQAVYSREFHGETWMSNPYGLILDTESAAVSALLSRASFVMTAGLDCAACNCSQTILARNGRKQGMSE